MVFFPEKYRTFTEILPNIGIEEAYRRSRTPTQLTVLALGSIVDYLPLDNAIQVADRISRTPTQLTVLASVSSCI